MSSKLLSNMVKAKSWRLVKHFDGVPKLSDFKLVEEDLPPIKEGEILLKTEYLTVDPYMRKLAETIPEGSIMPGEVVGKIIQSKHPKFAEGHYAVAKAGWASHGVLSPGVEGFFDNIQVFPDIGDLPRSLVIGTLGMPGVTAYFGLLKVCQAKKGETVVVTAASGAVGSIVGQIAKIKGCRVIGYAGTDEKCKWLTDELGFDFAFNYKTSDMDETLKQAAPNGVDCHFDNVGGEMSEKILFHMNNLGRVALCGAISSYNEASPFSSRLPGWTMLANNIKIEGFNFSRFKAYRPEAIQEMAQWIRQGKLKYRESVKEGLDKMPEAFTEIFTGKNTGKIIIKV